MVWSFAEVIQRKGWPARGLYARLHMAGALFLLRLLLQQGPQARGALAGALGCGGIVRIRHARGQAHVFGQPLLFLQGADGSPDAVLDGFLLQRQQGVGRVAVAGMAAETARFCGLACGQAYFCL